MIVWEFSYVLLGRLAFLVLRNGMENWATQNALPKPEDCISDALCVLRVFILFPFVPSFRLFV
jgi:hypothetical protein